MCPFPAAPVSPSALKSSLILESVPCPIMQARKPLREEKCYVEKNVKKDVAKNVEVFRRCWGGCGYLNVSLCCPSAGIWKVGTANGYYVCQ